MSTRRPRCTARWQRRRNLRYVRSIREVGRGSGFNPWVSGAARRPHESVALCRHRDRGARLGVLGRDSLLSARLTTRIGRGRSAAAGRSPHHRFKAQSQGDFPTYMRRVARLPGRLRAVARASASYNQLLRISAPPATSSHLLRRWPLPPAQVVRTSCAGGSYLLRRCSEPPSRRRRRCRWLTRPPSVQKASSADARLFRPSCTALKRTARSSCRRRYTSEQRNSERGRQAKEAEGCPDQPRRQKWRSPPPSRRR